MKRFCPQSQTHEKNQVYPRGRKATGSNFNVAQDVRRDLRVRKNIFMKLLGNVAEIKAPDCDERADS